MKSVSLLSKPVDLNTETNVLGSSTAVVDQALEIIQSLGLPVSEKNLSAKDRSSKLNKQKKSVDRQIYRLEVNEYQNIIVNLSTTSSGKLSSIYLGIEIKYPIALSTGITGTGSQLAREAKKAVSLFGDTRPRSIKRKINGLVVVTTVNLGGAVRASARFLISKYLLLAKKLSVLL